MSNIRIFPGHENEEMEEDFDFTGYLYDLPDGVHILINKKVKDDPRYKEAKHRQDMAIADLEKKSTRKAVVALIDTCDDEHCLILNHAYQTGLEHGMAAARAVFEAKGATTDK